MALRSNIFNELVCPKCGKTFFKPVENIYKIKIKTQTHHYCSYSCYVSKLKELGRW